MAINSTFHERRSEARHEVAIPGTIFVSPSLPVRCTLLDLSNSGAKVTFAGYHGQLPSSVKLHEELHDNVFICDVRWQRLYTAGLQFVDACSRAERLKLLASVLAAK